MALVIEEDLWLLRPIHLCFRLVWEKSKEVCNLRYYLKFYFQLFLLPFSK